jgi:hypothetical protein
MKQLTCIVVLLCCLNTQAQDTVIQLNGDVRAVQILKLDEAKNLIVYKFNDNTIYAELTAIKEYKLHSDLSASSSNGTIDNAVAIKQSGYIKEKASMQRNYSPLSIGTNLTSFFSFGALNRRMTIEPEYQLLDNFSLKFPIVIGLTTQIELGETSGWYANDGSYAYGHSFTSINSPPGLFFTPERRHITDVKAQIGINPKYYFNGKSKNIISWYGSASFNFGIADMYSISRWDNLDTVNYYNSNTNEVMTSWSAETTREFVESSEYNYFNWELLLGIDINISRMWTLTLETGYSSRFIGQATEGDKVYRSVLGGEYVLIHDEQPKFYYDRTQNIKGRLLLVYRF